MKFLLVLILAVFFIFGCDSLKGPTGPDGPQGETGEQGSHGAPGEKGDQGDKGETGLQGKQGIRGEKGDTGPQGDQGDTGEAVYTEVAIDEDNGLLLITDSSWSYENSWLSSYILVVSGLAENVGTSQLDYVTIYSKAYNSSGRLISVGSDSIDEWHFKPGQVSLWKIADYDCDEKPSRVTLGYSFDVTVMVAAPKRSPSPREF